MQTDANTKQKQTQLQGFLGWNKFNEIEIHSATLQNALVAPGKNTTNGAPKQYKY